MNKLLRLQGLKLCLHKAFGSSEIFCPNLSQSRLVSNTSPKMMYVDDNLYYDNAQVIDLRSDTLSKPEEQMRIAMFNAEVGDDVYKEDPTVNELERKAALITGKEAALFVPSGTMGNLVAVLVHCEQRSSEAIVGDKSHIVLWEQGGCAQIGGVSVRTLKNRPDGTFSLDELQAEFNCGVDIHKSITTLVCVENTHNFCGGKVLPLKWLDELGALSKKLNFRLHMDGARVFNAAVALGVPVSRIVADFDSVTFCLSKGLGAPIGSVLCGSADFIKKATRLRKSLGGGMRQAGIVAAAGIYALDYMVDRLVDDHRRTLAIAKCINDLNCHFINVDPENVHSNILIINFDEQYLTAPEFRARLTTVTDEELEEIGEGYVVRLMSMNNSMARIVLYCNLTDEDIQAAIKKIRFIIGEFKRNMTT
nr:PREDICTED: probable low-specificity L-threonine aldolase 2 [Bemisia tabaci]